MTKICVFMCGALRSFSFNYFYFKKNFIDILEKKGCVVDVYINAYSFSNNSKNEVNSSVSIYKKIDLKKIIY